MDSRNLSKKAALVCKDHTVSGKDFSLLYDARLDMLITSPRPNFSELPEFYKSEKYISHTDASTSLFDRIYQWVKTYMIDQKLKWIENDKKDRGRLLDIGAGTGDFLLRAESKGWETEGVEPNEGARQLALKKGVELQENSSSLTDFAFDVITMWHVLEHVPDLEKQLKQLRRLLKEDGLLIIAVPNFKSEDAKHYKEFWAAYDVPRHFWHFSRKSIENIFDPHGFGLIKAKGLIFDAFYVSMLSEKYRSGSKLPLKGFWNGLLSNLKAQKTKEYSSVAYFLRKR